MKTKYWWSATLVILACAHGVHSVDHEYPQKRDLGLSMHRGAFKLGCTQESGFDRQKHTECLTGTRLGSCHIYRGTCEGITVMVTSDDIVGLARTFCHRVIRTPGANDRVEDVPDAECGKLADRLFEAGRPR